MMLNDMVTDHPRCPECTPSCTQLRGIGQLAGQDPFLAGQSSVLFWPDLADDISGDVVLYRANMNMDQEQSTRVVHSISQLHRTVTPCS